jgi:putative ABC transport system substrate-binding protein
VHVIGKSLEMLKEIIPRVSRVAVLWNPDNAIFQAQMLREAQIAAGTLKIELQPFGAVGPDEFDRAFGAVTKARVGALLVLPEPMFNVHRTRFVDFAETSRLPAVFGTKEFSLTGGLMSYGPDYADSWRRAAFYVDKILKGARPSDLPVEQPTKFELIINLKNRQGSWPGHAPIAFGSRGQGHRMTPTHPAGPPMTLGNMREHEVHRLVPYFLNDA